MNTSFPICPEGLSDEQRQLYDKKGYIAFENVLSQDEVRQAQLAMSAMIRKYAFNDELSEQVGESTEEENVWGGVGFQSKSSRFSMHFENGFEPVPGDFEGMELGLRKFMWFENEDSLFQSLCSDHPRAMGVVQSVLGDAPRLYQSMALVKPARIGAPKAWHQDNAYFSVSDMDAVIGVWIALEDATPENGCMHVIEGAHRDGPLKHVQKADCEIAAGRINKGLAKAVPLKAGGALFFHGNLPHFTPPNRSTNRRRALQFHFRARDNDEISREAYDGIFKESSGAPATCHAARPENF